MKLLICSLFLVIVWCESYCQSNQDVVGLPARLAGEYLHTIDKKIAHYKARLQRLDAQSISRLCRFEEKFRRLLNKINPGAAAALFGPEEWGFASVRERLEKPVPVNFSAPYNKYTDELQATIRYLQTCMGQDCNSSQQVDSMLAKMKAVLHHARQSAYLGELIAQRKEQLVRTAAGFLKKNKWLTRINQEAFDFQARADSYEKAFSTGKPMEEKLHALLLRQPVFRAFLQENSLRSQIFGSAMDGPIRNELARLQTAANTQRTLRELFGASPNGAAALHTAKQKLMSEIKRVSALGAERHLTASDDGNFSINPERAKTFRQRLSVSSDLQSFTTGAYLPSTTSLGLSLAYQFNGHARAGVGGLMGIRWGQGWKHLHFSRESLGARAFCEWKWRANIYLYGGYEQTSYARFRDPRMHKYTAGWKQAGLVGLTRQLPGANAFVKATRLQLLYDFLYRQRLPVTQPILFRAGYTF